MSFVNGAIHYSSLQRGMIDACYLLPKEERCKHGMCTLTCHGCGLCSEAAVLDSPGTTLRVWGLPSRLANRTLDSQVWKRRGHWFWASFSYKDIIASAKWDCFLVTQKCGHGTQASWRVGSQGLQSAWECRENFLHLIPLLLSIYLHYSSYPADQLLCSSAHMGGKVTFLATSRIPLPSPWLSPWPPLKLLDKGSGDIAGPVNCDQIVLYKHGTQEPTPVDVHGIVKEAFARGVVFQKVPTCAHQMIVWFADPTLGYSCCSTSLLWILLPTGNSSFATAQPTRLLFFSCAEMGLRPWVYFLQHKDGFLSLDIYSHLLMIRQIILSVTHAWVPAHLWLSSWIWSILPVPAAVDCVFMSPPLPHPIPMLKS